MLLLSLNYTVKENKYSPEKPLSFYECMKKHHLKKKIFWVLI